MNAKLHAIAEKAATDLQSLIEESEANILKAWDAAEQESQDNETPPKFKLGLTITLDLDKDTMETALTYGIKHKLSVACTIPDPNQPDLLPESGINAMTMENGKSVMLDSQTASRALKALNKLATK